MTSAHAAPEACAYCGTPVDDEQSYRRHLATTHDPAELGAIDRRRYEQYSPEPGVARKAGSRAADTLTGLRYPVGGATMARYAAYGFLTSFVVAAMLGVGV